MAHAHVHLSTSILNISEMDGCYIRIYKEGPIEENRLSL